MFHTYETKNNDSLHIISIIFSPNVRCAKGHSQSLKMGIDEPEKCIEKRRFTRNLIGSNLFGVYAGFGWTAKREPPRKSLRNSSIYVLPKNQQFETGE